MALRMKTGVLRRNWWWVVSIDRQAGRLVTSERAEITNNPVRYVGHLSFFMNILSDSRSKIIYFRCTHCFSPLLKSK